MDTNLINAIQSVGFPIVSSIALGWFCYKICFTKLNELGEKIDNLEEKLNK